MKHRLQAGPQFERTESGATLVAVLILVSAGTILALGALRSATIEAQLSATLGGAQEAFWLAESGIASGLQFASSRPGNLPDTEAIALGAINIPNRGHAETEIHPGGADNYCPPLSPASVIRHHYEIHATGYGDRGAISTHVQGFYICSELCTAPDCAVPEIPPVRSYWKAVTGGLRP